jgi:hypothetical protein
MKTAEDGDDQRKKGGQKLTEAENTMEIKNIKRRK